MEILNQLTNTFISNDLTVGTIIIEKSAGRWLINDRQYSECSLIEQKFFCTLIDDHRELVGINTDRQRFETGDRVV